jgi:hypothetical protein
MVFSARFSSIAKAKSRQESYPQQEQFNSSAEEYFPTERRAFLISSWEKTLATGFAISNSKLVNPISLIYNPLNVKM